MRMRRSGFTILFIITIFGLLFSAVNAIATPPQPPKSQINLQLTENIISYTGGVIWVSHTFKLDTVRFSIYDVNQKLRETGLLSEYTENKEFGRYLKFTDINDNDILDLIDMFIIPKSGITDDWGLVFSYEPSGRTLLSRTISNKEFSLKEDEKEYDPTIYILIFEFHVFSLILILVCIYIRKKDLF
jgi:hypothetical protein